MLNKVRLGSNMYQWLTHTWSPLGGKCGHECKYCYVEALKTKPALKAKYSGPYRLIEKEMRQDLGRGNIIFVEHCGDLFAVGVHEDYINDILEHCKKYDNTYLFQTKNPARFMEFLPNLPPKVILGTTIESNREYGVSRAPKPEERVITMKALSTMGYTTMCTLEPLMDFDVDVMVEWIKDIKPTFINVGADSKGHGLHEPAPSKIYEFINTLTRMGVDVKIKSNLKRVALL